VPVVRRADGDLPARTEREVVLYERRPDIRRVDMDVGRRSTGLADRGIHALKRADVFDDVERC